jgi:site-specific DNA-cytosine methylase
MDKIKMLELFKGTGSQGKAGEALGILPSNIQSVDMVEKFNPTHLGNILDLDYTKLEVPDIITASPPCETFSLLIATHKVKVRNYKTDMKPLTEKGRNGDQVLFKTLEIINYFLDKNPNLVYVIENPRGFMKKMECMKELPFMTEGWYSCYGTNYRKPTNFWSNRLLTLYSGKEKEKEVGTKLPPGNDLLSVLPRREDRYIIPHELCKSIITQLLKN